jgi:hypothetical protein
MGGRKGHCNLANSFGSSAAAANTPPIIAPVIPVLPTS